MDKFEKLFAEYPWTLSDEAVKEAADDILAKHFDENNNVEWLDQCYASIVSTPLHYCFRQNVLQEYQLPPL